MDNNISVPVLYVMKGSNYHSIPGCELYDEERNARTFDGQHALITHPPCRKWSKLREFSTAPESEKGEAVFAFSKVIQNGGVLEHPSTSLLWKYFNLTPGNNPDGYLHILDLSDFGFPARKRTGIFISGIDISEMPAPPLNLKQPTHSIEGKHLPSIPKKMRSETPIEMCHYLVNLARHIEYRKRIL